MTGVDLDGAMIATLLASGELDAGRVGRAGDLPYPDRSFDVVLYRLVLHHIAYQGPLAPVFSEAARLLRARPARSLQWSRVRGIRSGRGSRWPTGPGSGPGRTGRRTTSRCRRVRSCPRRARPASLRSSTASHTAGGACRRRSSARIHRLDPLGSRPRAAPFAHTLLLIARA